MKKKLFNKFKRNEGFTLIEVLITVLMLAIVSIIMIEGVKMALIAYNINKAKTEASEIANEEIEKIRSLPFNDLGIKYGDPVGVLDPQRYTTDNYLVEYSVTWAEESNRIKQVKVSVFKSPMKNKVEVITEITDLGEILSPNSTTTSTATTTSSATIAIPATTKNLLSISANI
ncbi:MAG: prepilin-type N-terminal cleavage/methylation domain-containing protein [Actinobacteria bacterium]|nr:prepilin-type N-terminal cleavage/methylation domain-containing protein [Actinomycetota bacterium]